MTGIESQTLPHSGPAQRGVLGIDLVKSLAVTVSSYGTRGSLGAGLGRAVS